MKRLLHFIAIIFISTLFLHTTVYAVGQAGSLDSEGPLIQNLKKTYRDCVLDKGVLILNIADFETAVQYAPVACKREFLRLEQDFISNTLMPDASRELLRAYEVGIEIDLVNHLISVSQN